MLLLFGQPKNSGIRLLTPRISNTLIQTPSCLHLQALGGSLRTSQYWKFLEALYPPSQGTSKGSHLLLSSLCFCSLGAYVSPVILNFRDALGLPPKFLQPMRKAERRKRAIAQGIREEESRQRPEGQRPGLTGVVLLSPTVAKGVLGLPSCLQSLLHFLQSGTQQSPCRKWWMSRAVP